MLVCRIASDEGGWSRRSAVLEGCFVSDRARVQRLMAGGGCHLTFYARLLYDVALAECTNADPGRLNLTEVRGAYLPLQGSLVKRPHIT